MALAPRSLAFDLIRAEVLAAGQVVPDPARCVQCGICPYNSPLGLDVRAYVWRGEPIADARCPRGALRFAPTARGEAWQRGGS